MNFRMIHHKTRAVAGGDAEMAAPGRRWRWRWRSDWGDSGGVWAGALAAMWVMASVTALAGSVPSTQVSSPARALSVGQVAGPGAVAGAATDAQAEARFAALERDYVGYLLRQFPVMSTRLGGAGVDPALAEVDGLLRDYSPAALSAEDARLQTFRAEFTRLEARQLSARRRIDGAVALAQIDFLLHQQQARQQQIALDSYLDEPLRGVDWLLQTMAPTGPSTLGTQAQWDQVIARTRAIPRFLATAQEQLAAGVKTGRAPDWRVLVQFGLGGAVSNAEYFAGGLQFLALDRMAGPARGQQLKQLRQAGGEAATAYYHLRDWVVATFFENARRTDVSALKPRYRADRYALGAAEYDWALRNNLRLQTTAAQLYEQSWPKVLATRAQLVQLAGEIAAGQQGGVIDDDAAAARVRRIFATLGQRAPATDAAMMVLYQTTGRRLIDYARRVRLFDLPVGYTLDVARTPLRLRAAIVGAAYRPAPVFKPDGAGRLFVTFTRNDPALLQQLHPALAAPGLVAGQGFPGRQWRDQVMAHAPEPISPIRGLALDVMEDAASMWADSLATDGWALYAQTLLAEPQTGASLGVYTPEERLLQLREQLNRELRVRVDTGIHTGRLSLDDAVTLYSQVLDFEPGSCLDPQALSRPAKANSCKTARAAVTRQARLPTQAIAAQLGMEQILALRAQAREQAGPGFSLPRFHLEFTRQGNIPSGYFADELLRLLGQP